MPSERIAAITRGNPMPGGLPEGGYLGIGWRGFLHGLQRRAGGAANGDDGFPAGEVAAGDLESALRLHCGP